MAPSYYTATNDQDLKSLMHVELHKQTSPRAAYIGALCGMVCAVILIYSTTPGASSFKVQPHQAVSIMPTAATSVAKAAGPTLLQKVGHGLAALSLTTMANLGTPSVAPAAEVDVLSTPTPTSAYVFDDGSLLSKSTTSALQAKLPEIEQRTGYRINLVTLRKLVISDDAFQFADNVIETWYPTAELGDKKAVLVLVKNTKEGGVVGGPSFTKSVPGAVVESIVNDNFGKLLAQEKFNQAAESAIDRLDAVLSGRADPGPPKVLFANDAPKQTQTYKTKEETDEKRGLYGTIFGVLVVISFVAPMVQYFTYTKDDA